LGAATFYREELKAGVPPGYNYKNLEASELYKIDIFSRYVQHLSEKRRIGQDLRYYLLSCN
jgi:hypothetical protein